MWIRSLGLVVAIGVLVSACASETPLAPVAPVPLDLTAPASLTLDAAIGQGPTAGRSTITARVLNAVGGKLAGIPVSFTTDVGTLSIASATTAADGTATTVITAASTAVVTATAARLTTKTLVASQPLVPVIPPSVPPPVVPPIVIPPPVLSPGYTVTLAAAPTSVVAGQSSTLTATVALLNGATVPTAYDWDCTNDGVIDATTPGNSNVCVYPTAGTIAARVTARNATTSGGGSTSVTVLPGLVVVLTCAPQPFGTPTTCNVTASYGGITLPGASVTNVNWDWADSSVLDNNSTGPVKAHTYAGGGTYTVFATATATTVDGAKTATASKTIVVP